MVRKKAKSKRQSLHQKYKIVKKVREHKRKLRKAEKNAKPKKTKDPGIPNTWPFKEEMLLQLEQQKIAEEEAKLKAKEARKLEKKQMKLAEKDTLSQLTQIPILPSESIETSAKLGLQNSIVDADLIVLVLDARDPQGTRSLSLEDGLVKQKHKVLIVLNKIDLVPSEVTEKWLSYLRRFHPTLPCVSLQSKEKNSSKKVKLSKEAQAAAAFQSRMQSTIGMTNYGNTRCLKEFLQEFGKNHTGKRRLNVTFVGYPNVGKSSIVNALIRRNVVEVSSKARSTFKSTTVQFNESLNLIDSPALKAECSDPSSSLMRHCIASLHNMDPTPIVSSVLARVDKVDITRMCCLPSFESDEDFLIKFSKKKKLIRKGGDPNVIMAGRLFLHSMTSGAFPFYCLPSTNQRARYELPEWYKKLDNAEINKQEKQLLIQMNHDNKKLYLQLNSLAPNHVVGDSTEYDIAVGNIEMDEMEVLNSGTDEDEENSEEEISVDEEEEGSSNSCDDDDDENEEEKLAKKTTSSKKRNRNSRH